MTSYLFACLYVRNPNEWNWERMFVYLEKEKRKRSQLSRQRQRRCNSEYYVCESNTCRTAYLLLLHASTHLTLCVIYVEPVFQFQQNLLAVACALAQPTAVFAFIARFFHYIFLLHRFSSHSSIIRIKMRKKQNLHDLANGSSVELSSSQREETSFILSFIVELI